MSGGEAPGAAPAKSALLELAQETDRELNGPAMGPGAGEGEPGQPGQGGALASLSLEDEIAGMFAMIGEGLGQFLPSAKAVLTEDKARDLGRVLAPLARKYHVAHYIEGFAWRVELQAAMVVIPVALALGQAIKSDVAKLKAAQGSAAQVDQLPDSGIVAPAKADAVPPRGPVLAPNQ